MRTFVSALCAALFLSVSAVAADIPTANRIKNKPPGYCGWCCLETLGRTLGIPKLATISTDREKDPDFLYYVQEGQFLRPVLEPKNGSSRLSVKCKLTDLGVKHRITVFDRQHLETAAEQTGCVVFIKAGGFGPEPHAVLATHYDDKFVRLIDPNTTKEQTYTRETFDKWWDGTTISVEK
jgi:hypothetical protein